MGDVSCVGSRLRRSLRETAALYIALIILAPRSSSLVIRFFACALHGLLSCGTAPAPSTDIANDTRRIACYNRMFRHVVGDN